jgi:hypothetical protein
MSFDFSSINHTNYSEVLDFIYENAPSFQREENRIRREEAKNHLIKHDIKVGMWFQHVQKSTNGWGDVHNSLYELQVKKISRTCIEATGFQISPVSQEFTERYPLKIRIIDVIP